MELKFSKKFVRQLEEYKNDEKLFQILSKKIKYFESVSEPAAIHELVQIRKTTAHFRIKIKISDKKVYRIGISILKRVIWLACIENDKRRFYKQFP